MKKVNKNTEKWVKLGEFPSTVLKNHVLSVMLRYREYTGYTEYTRL